MGSWLWVCCPLLGEFWGQSIDIHLDIDLAESGGCGMNKANIFNEYHSNINGRVWGKKTIETNLHDFVDNFRDRKIVFLNDQIFYPLHDET